MSQIRITPDQMRARAGEYRNQADAIQEITRKLDNLLQVLQGEWEGQASRDYATTYTNLRPSFTKVEDLTRQIADALDKTANKFEAADKF